MEPQEEIHGRLSKIRTALAQAAQACGVMRAVPEELCHCLQQLSTAAQQVCQRHLRTESESDLAAALDALHAQAEQACALSGCGQGDAHRLRLALEEARQDMRDLRHQLGLPRPAADAA